MSKDSKNNTTGKLKLRKATAKDLTVKTDKAGKIQGGKAKGDFCGIAVPTCVVFSK